VSHHKFINKRWLPLPQGIRKLSQSASSLGFRPEVGFSSCPEPEAIVGRSQEAGLDRKLVSL